MEHYLLTDTDLKRLGSITKENPRKKGWSAMRLYLQSQASSAVVLLKRATVSFRLSAKIHS